MELEELFLAIEYFLEEFFAACPAAHLLTRSHLLLKTIQSASFFLAVSEYSLSFIEVAVDQLVLEKVISVAFAHELGICLLIGGHIQLNLLSKGLLDWIKLDQVLLQRCLLFDPVGCVVIVDQHLELA